MAKGGKVAKTASKNNPTQRNKGTAKKLYDGKSIKPVMYIDRSCGVRYVAAQYENGSIVEDKSGNPLKWSNI
ncbi:hypothetical protein [Candidatus Mesenet endosymbiont of Agriotes lineatus]|uniref:hypothetical protein n=1 Tax=Candidatus Mesenet endosymbiont of Agriotes lineatus TaxID=3077948 RepID=UPI0030CA6592